MKLIMVTSTVIQISPNELAILISEQLKLELGQFLANPKVIDIQSTEKPHLTRKETAKFFSVSLNCINDWCNRGILKPFKVGQRTYFKKTHVLQVLFESKGTKEN